MFCPTSWCVLIENNRGHIKAQNNSDLLDYTLTKPFKLQQYLAFLGHYFSLILFPPLLVKTLVTLNTITTKATLGQDQHFHKSFSTFC